MDPNSNPANAAPEATPAGDIFEVTLVTPFGTQVIRARASEHIWDEAKRAGLVLPSICHQGRCLTCAGRLIDPGESLPSQAQQAQGPEAQRGELQRGEKEPFDSSDAVSYFPQDRAAGFILLCTAKPRANLRIRTHMQNEMRAHRRALGLPAPYS